MTSASVEQGPGARIGLVCSLRTRLSHVRLGAGDEVSEEVSETGIKAL